MWEPRDHRAMALHTVTPMSKPGSNRAKSDSEKREIEALLARHAGETGGPGGSVVHSEATTQDYNSASTPVAERRPTLNKFIVLRLEDTHENKKTKRMTCAHCAGTLLLSCAGTLDFESHHSLLTQSREILGRKIVVQRLPTHRLYSKGKDYCDGFSVRPENVRNVKTHGFATELGSWYEYYTAQQLMCTQCEENVGYLYQLSSDVEGAVVRLQAIGRGMSVRSLHALQVKAIRHHRKASKRTGIRAFYKVLLQGRLEREERKRKRLENAAFTIQRFYHSYVKEEMVVTPCEPAKKKGKKRKAKPKTTPRKEEDPDRVRHLCRVGGGFAIVDGESKDCPACNSSLQDDESSKGSTAKGAAASKAKTTPRATPALKTNRNSSNACLQTTSRSNIRRSSEASSSKNEEQMQAGQVLQAKTPSGSPVKAVVEARFKALMKPNVPMTKGKIATTRNNAGRGAGRPLTSMGFAGVRPQMLGADENSPCLVEEVYQLDQSGAVIPSPNPSNGVMTPGGKPKTMVPTRPSSVMALASPKRLGSGRCPRLTGFGGGGPGLHGGANRQRRYSSGGEASSAYVKAMNLMNAKAGVGASIQ